MPPSEIVDGHDELLLREAARGRFRLWKRLVYVLGVVALVVAIGFGARPALHVVKAWQSRRLARQAVRLTGEGKFDEARVKVQDALAIWPLEPEALHAAAVFLTRANAYRQALGFWEQLDKQEPLAVEDLREYANVELNLGDLDAAEALQRRFWPAGTPGARADWLVAMQIALRRGRGAEASEMAQRILSDTSASPRDHLNAAAVVISTHSASPEDQARAWNTVEEIAAGGQSQESLAAMILLAQHGADKGGGATAAPGTPTLDELIARVDAHPLAKTQHHLLGLDLQLGRDPSRKAEVVQTAVDRYGKTKDDGELATLTAWLYGKAEYEKILELLPPERAVNDRALYLQYLDTLAALGRWGDIRASIQARKFPLDAMLGQMFLARCAGQLGETAVRDARWQAAMDAAGRDPAKLVALGQYAAKNGATATALASFEAAIRADPDSRAAHEELVRALETAGDTTRLRAAITDMAARWPQDPTVRNDSAYLDALLGQNLPAARTTARDLIQAAPTLLAARVTLALTELRLHHALAALDAFSGFDFARVVSPQPRELAVYARVLWETSFPREAGETLRQLPADQLLPEERELIAPIHAGSTQ